MTVNGIKFLIFLCSDELGRFVANKRCLTSLKMEGCSNLGGFVLCSSSLSTLWLSDLYCLSKMVNVFFYSFHLTRRDESSSLNLCCLDQRRAFKGGLLLVHTYMLLGRICWHLRCFIFYSSMALLCRSLTVPI